MEKIKLNIQKFATKRTTFSESNINVTNNTSSLTISIYFSADNQYTWFASATLNCTCNGQTQSKNVSLSTGGSVSASFTFNNIKHNDDGKKSVSWSWSCATDTSVLGTISDSGTRELTKINRAVINSFIGNDINGIFKVNYTTYSNDYNYKLRISIPSVIALETFEYISDTEFTLSQDSLDYIYNYTTTTNNVTLGAVIETWNGNTKIAETEELKNVCQITNANPIFNYFYFDDMNSTTVALTGNTQYNINNYSNIRAKVPKANHAIAQKGATMVKYRFTIGNKSQDLDYDSSKDANISIPNSPGGTYNVYAIDSRGNSTLVTKLASSVISYEPISFDSSTCKVERSNNGVGKNAVLTLSGTIWNDNFGVVTNSIKNVTYWYKKTSDSEWITGPTTINPTITDNTFKFEGQVGSLEDGYTFDLNNSYDFLVRIDDELSTKQIQLTPMAKAIPNISLADNGVGIMCDYDESLGGLLQVGGEVFNSESKPINITTNSAPVKLNFQVDGKDVYLFRKNIGNLPNKAIKRVAVEKSILDFDKVNLILLTGTAREPSSRDVPLPYVNTSNISYGIAIDFRYRDNDLLVETGYDRSNMTGYINVFFTYK